MHDLTELHYLLETEVNNWPNGWWTISNNVSI